MAASVAGGVAGRRKKEDKMINIIGPWIAAFVTLTIIFMTIFMK